MKLVIVESPTKAKTISRFLGDDFKIESSYGHVRDLPEKKFGIDLEHNFEPQYTILPKAKKRVAELKNEAEKSSEVVLATDEDREGEAIAWHLVQALGLENPKPKIRNPKQIPNTKYQILNTKYQRIVFHEITKAAIEKALKNPRGININLVDAQQARRILDRLVGYKLSPFLWKKVAKGLSAGRVQSVAVRLVVECEREILNFRPEEFWTIIAKLKKAAKGFETQLIKIGEKKLQKFSIKTKDESDKIISDLKNVIFKVARIGKRKVERQPLPPFITSTLQQTAWARLGFSAKQTMLIAQELYETGLITYMRTDSFNLSQEAIVAAHEKIKTTFGNNYLLPGPRIYKTKSKSAQEAHEAIRPSMPDKDPESLRDQLKPQHFKLYDLVWKRFMATQMPNAIFEATAADIEAIGRSNEKYTFRASGSVLKFDGFLKAYPQKFSETSLPELKEKENLDLEELKPLQHFTEPPARYTEAGLIKALEEYGIGRPSTYAPTMSTIQTRRYVIKDENKRLKPTDIGILVNDILVEHFPKIVDLEFTAHMEEDLDEIARGKRKWRIVIKEFWDPFEANLEKKSKELKKETTMEKTELKCPECGKMLIIRMGRYGKFYACSGFPSCKYTASIEQQENPENLGHCPKCDIGQIVKRRTKKGRTFWGCSRWPKCDYATWENPQKNPPPEIPENEKGSEE